MFDIGFWELFVIGIVALLVIGPERLPAVARKAGMWMGRARRLVQQVKDDIDRELAADELRRALKDQSDRDSVYEIVEETKQTIAEAKSSLDETKRALEEDATAAADAAREAKAAVENSAQGGQGAQLESGPEHNPEPEYLVKAAAENGESPSRTADTTDTKKRDGGSGSQA
jgi:sec-independent protein translocase protein TatB